MPLTEAPIAPTGPPLGRRRRTRLPPGVERRGPAGDPPASAPCCVDVSLRIERATQVSARCDCQLRHSAVTPIWTSRYRPLPSLTHRFADAQIAIQPGATPIRLQRAPPRASRRARPKRFDRRLGHAAVRRRSGSGRCPARSAFHASEPARTVARPASDPLAQLAVARECPATVAQT